MTESRRRRSTVTETLPSSEDDDFDESKTRLGLLIQRVRDLKASLAFESSDGDSDDRKAPDDQSAEEHRIMQSIQKKRDMNDALIQSRNESLSNKVKCLKEQSERFRRIDVSETMEDIIKEEHSLESEKLRLEKEIDALHQQILEQRHRMKGVCSKHKSAINECNAIIEHDQVKIPSLKTRVSFYRQIVNVRWSNESRSSCELICAGKPGIMSMHMDDDNDDDMSSVILKGVVFSGDGSQMSPFEFDLKDPENGDMCAIRDSFWNHAEN